MPASAAGLRPLPLRACNPAARAAGRRRAYHRSRKLLLQLQLLSACAFLRDLNVSLHGILPDDERMWIARLAHRQSRKLLERSVEDRVIGQDDVGARLLDDV